MFTVISVFLLALTSVLALDSCPDFKTKQTLDISVYVNTSWNEIARYPNKYQSDEKCLVLNFSFEDGMLKGKPTNLAEGSSHYYSVANVPSEDPQYELKTIISYGNPRKTEVSKLKILLPAENDYGIFYNCKYNEDLKTYQDFAWVFINSEKMKGDIRTGAENLIKSFDFLDISKFIWIDDSEESCRLSS